MKSNFAEVTPIQLSCAFSYKNDIWIGPGIESFAEGGLSEFQHSFQTIRMNKNFPSGVAHFFQLVKKLIG